jgi:hypothetical protein
MYNEILPKKYKLNVEEIKYAKPFHCQPNRRDKAFLTTSSGSPSSPASR